MVDTPCRRRDGGWESQPYSSQVYYTQIKLYDSSYQLPALELDSMGPPGVTVIREPDPHLGPKVRT